jgi:hydrogenase expression/formation protein HypC
MCLAIPVKVVKVKGNLAEVSMSGVKRQADIRFLENIKPGDYILLHAGFAIEKIDEKEAQETLKLLKDIYYD